LRLGEISYRQYEELTGLAHTLFRIYRSLQQPGHFLVVPTTYRIARYAASQDRAYRPALMVYVTVDPTAPTNNRVNLRTTLIPAFPLHVRRELVGRLQAYASGFTPVLEYPTDIPLASLPTPQWTIDPAVEVRTAIQPGSDAATGAIEVLLA